MLIFFNYIFLGVVCAGDISHDMSLSIAIGLSLCSLVICVLFGLAINHLRQKDEVFKPVDTTGDDQKSWKYNDDYEQCSQIANI